MSALISFGLIFIVAYMIQAFLGLKQMKTFNQRFQELHKKGRVVVGKRSGRLIAGTIILFLVDEKGIIQEGLIMQGVTVFARFKRFDQFDNLALINLNPHHPLLEKEAKFTRMAIENARELYTRFLLGAMKEEAYSAISPFGLNLSYTWNKFKLKFQNHR